MPRKLKPPSYLKQTTPTGDRARTVLRLPGGRVEYHGLGIYGSPESYAEHQRLTMEWRAAWEADAAGEVHRNSDGPVRTVNQLVSAFLAHAASLFVHADGTPKQEMANHREALRPVVRLYGAKPVSDFGPRALKAVRNAMASGGWRTEEERFAIKARSKHPGWARRTVNRHLKRVKRVWKWAESEGLVISGTHHALSTVEGLRHGEAGVRESDDVPPVPEAVLEATLPHLGAVVRALVQVQLLTGARPGELVGLKPNMLERSGTVDLGKGLQAQAGECWALVPRSHKTAHRNRKRIILFGPQAQAVMAPLLDGRDPDAFVFSPQEARRLHDAERGRKRVTKRTPSERKRSHKMATKKRQPGARYTVGSYNQAVRRACRRAFPPPLVLSWEALREWDRSHSWHVHQLRHNAATRLVKEFGEETARAVLGHSAVDTTRIYALRDVSSAAQAVGKVG